MRPVVEWTMALAEWTRGYGRFTDVYRILVRGRFDFRMWTNRLVRGRIGKWLNRPVAMFPVCTAYPQAALHLPRKYTASEA